MTSSSEVEPQWKNGFLPLMEEIQAVRSVCLPMCILRPSCQQWLFSQGKTNNIRSKYIALLGTSLILSQDGENVEDILTMLIRVSLRTEDIALLGNGSRVSICSGICNKPESSSATRIHNSSFTDRRGFSVAAETLVAHATCPHEISSPDFPADQDKRYNAVEVHDPQTAHYGQ